MTHAELVEVMRSAMDLEMERIGDELEAGNFTAPADQIRRGCEAALSVLRAQGLTVVPREFSSRASGWKAVLVGLEAFEKSSRYTDGGRFQEGLNAAIAAGEIRPGEDEA